MLSLWAARGRDVVVACLLSGSLTACEGDGAMGVEAPGNLVVDGWDTLSFGDKCAGHPKGFCTTQQITGTPSIRNSNPSVLEILELDAVPRELRDHFALDGDRALHGLSPGRTQVCIDAHFDDGSDRSACTAITVSAPDAFAMTPFCDPFFGNYEPRARLIAPKRTLTFTVAPMSHGELLQGYLEHPVATGEITEVVSGMYSWTSPATGASVEIRSSEGLPIATLSTFDPAAVSEIEIYAGVPPRLAEPGELLDFSMLQKVGEEIVCLNAPPALRSETPDVCRVEAVQGEVPSDTALAVSEGDCELSCGVAGGDGYLTTFDIPFYFVDPNDAPRTSSASYACDVPGARTCDAGRGGMLACKKSASGNAYWEYAERCDGKICDFTKPAADCAPTEDCVACR